MARTLAVLDDDGWSCELCKPHGYIGNIHQMIHHLICDHDEKCALPDIDRRVITDDFPEMAVTG